MSYNIVIGTYEGVLYGINVEIKNSDFITNIIFSNKNHLNCIKSVTFCGNIYLASSSSDDTICLYDLNNKKEMGHLSQAKEYIKLKKLDESFLIGIDHLGGFEIWDIDQWKSVFILDNELIETPILLCAPHPNTPGIILLVDKNFNLKILNLYEKNCKYETCFKTQISLIEWFPSGNGFILIENKSTLTIIENKNSIKSYFIDTRQVLCVCIFDDNFCFVGSENGFITLVSFQNGVIYSWNAHDSRIKQINLLKDIHTIVSIDSLGIIKFWNIIQFIDQKPLLYKQFSIPFRPTCMDCIKV